MFSFSLETDLDFNKLRQELNLRGAETANRETVAEGVKGQFASEGARGGAKWEPLKPATIRDRLRKGFGRGPILKRTGQLEAEASKPVSAVSPDGQRQEITIQDQRGLVGIDTKGGGNLPSRPVYEPTDADVDRIAENVLEGL